MNIKKMFFIVLTYAALMLTACSAIERTSDDADWFIDYEEEMYPETEDTEEPDTEESNTEDQADSVNSVIIPGYDYTVPAYNGYASVEVNGNVPFFENDDVTTEAFEIYSELDDLGRCGVAYANICKELMPTEDRTDIGHIKPTGWHSGSPAEYNRCHLIAFCLAGENDNKLNLVTGTREMNVEGMLPYETEILDYVRETNHHVLYRVTPIFYDDELVCRGVLMEALSVEDDEIVFCVFCYNNQSGVTIDYATGENWTDEEYASLDEVQDFVLNKNSKKYHKPDCDAVSEMYEGNKQEYTGTINELREMGYEPCSKCFGNDD